MQGDRIDQQGASFVERVVYHRYRVEVIGAVSVETQNRDLQEIENSKTFVLSRRRNRQYDFAQKAPQEVRGRWSLEGIRVWRPETSCISEWLDTGAGV